MTDYKTKTDAELVALTLKDREVFSYLVNRYEAKLFRYIRRFTGVSVECAEDILQESFIKIYKNLNDFDKDLSFSSWAYRITHNEAVNYVKRINGHTTIPLETDDKDAVSLINILESETDIPKDFDKKDLRKKVQKIISMLSPDFREMLILRYLEEKDYKEISDILKKPMGTVATLVNRAKAQFKQIAEKNNLTHSSF